MHGNAREGEPFEDLSRCVKPAHEERRDKIRAAAPGAAGAHTGSRSARNASYSILEAGPAQADGRRTRFTEAEASIMRVLLGAVIGILVVWLSRSGRARAAARRRLSTAPESSRRAATSATAASAGQIGRVATVVDAAPVPPPPKDTLGRATLASGSTAETLGGAAMAGHAATLSVRESPDGSWIGDAAWGGHTLSDGAPDPEVLIRRLAMGLAAIPEAGRPERIKLTRVPWAGLREQHEEDFATLLG
jgi:hypothetical protein